MNYRNEFDDSPRGGFLANIGPKAAFFIVLIALSFMVGVVWKLYSGANNADGQNVPIVRADSDPFKVVPDDPGGMEIRHKDSTLFSAIKKERDEEEGEVRIENLLADDENEEPMPRSQLFAGLNTEPNPDLERDEEESTPLDQPVNDNIVKTIEEAEVPEEVKPEPEPEPAAMVQPAPKPKPAIKEEPTPAPVEIRTPSMPVVSQQASTGEYYIQLASTKDKSSVDSEWKKLSKKYSVISDLPYRVETADLGERGLFYRIQAGPISREEAQSKCAAIKKINPNGCLVKK
jgi:cell division septation protein DedD